MLRARCPMRRQPVSPYRTHAAPSVRPCVRAPIAASAQPELRQLAVQLLARQSQAARGLRSEEHTSELQSQSNLVCRLLLEKKRGRERDAALRAYRRPGEGAADARR